MEPIFQRNDVLRKRAETSRKEIEDSIRAINEKIRTNYALPTSIDLELFPKDPTSREVVFDYIRKGGYGIVPAYSGSDEDKKLIGYSLT